MWKRGGLVCILLLGHCSAADAPRPHGFEGRPIIAIRFEPQAQPLSNTELVQAIGLKAGEPFHTAQLRDAIKRLYATGAYTDVWAEGEPSTKGLTVVFRTTDRWFISRVESDEHVRQPPTPGQLVSSTRLDIGQPFMPGELQQVVDHVTRMLRANGYYEAKVEPQLQRDQAHQDVGIRLQVQAGPRAHLREPVITGNPEMKPGSVLKATKWHYVWPLGWRQATQQNVQSGLQKLRKKYQADKRLMASVSLQGITYDPQTKRATPKISVSGGPKVEVKTAGAKVSKRKLKEYVPIYDEMTVDPDLLSEGADNIRSYFQTKGYFGARVDYEIKQIGADHQQILYKINLGRRQKVVKVDVQGNRYFDTPAILERMLVQPSKFLRLPHGRYSLEAASHDETAIKQLYESNGFRDVKVRVRPGPQPKPGQMVVLVVIDEGPQYRVADLKLNGVHQLDAAQVRTNLSTAVGQPFSDISVALDRARIVRYYNDSGFPRASFSYAIRPGAQPNTYDVQYNIYEGPRQYVREVLITGTKVTRPRYYESALKIHKGQPLSTDAMTSTEQSLANLGVFDSVNMGVQNAYGDTPDKYVLFDLLEGHRYRLAGGAGAEVARVGGQNNYLNPGGATGFVPRANIDASRYNMWGLGHELNFKGRLSTIDKLATVNYYIRNYRSVEGRDITFTTEYENSRNVNTFTSKRFETSAQLSQKLSKSSTLLYRASFRHTSIDQSSLKIEPLLVPQFAQPDRVGQLALNYIFDRRNDPSDATEGIYSTLDFGVAEKAFASTVNFTRFLGTNAIYRPISGGVTFAQRVEFGWIAPFGLAAGLTSASAIPLPERFFAGGTVSMRGFPNDQAGPRDPVTGFPLGGNALLFSNTEIRFPLIGANIQGVGFWDAGNVYSTAGDISFRFHQRDVQDFNYMVHAVGFGVRYRTPLGPIRVDLAYSINPPKYMGLHGTPQQVLLGTAPRVPLSVSHFQFFFSIGQAF